MGARLERFKNEMSEQRLMHVSEYAAEDVSKAPVSTGIYAWYQRLYLSEADLVRMADFSDETGKHEAAFRLLERQTGIFSNPKINLTGSGEFGSTWQAVVQEVGALEKYSQHDANKNDVLEESARSLTFESLSPTAMRAMLDLLRLSIENFGAPLYVGKAKNLRKRLETHTRDLRKVTTGFRKDPEFRTALEEKLKTTELDFAHRAGMLGIDEDELIVRTINFQTMYPEIPSEDLYRLAGVVEYMMNRWYRPKLGKL